MDNPFLSIKFAGDILDKRNADNVSFRELQRLTGIDKTALHSMEVGDIPPKLINFFTVCLWLGKPMDTYFVKPKTKTNASKNKKGNVSGKRR